MAWRGRPGQADDEDDDKTPQQQQQQQQQQTLLLARLRQHRDECRTGGPEAQRRLLQEELHPTLMLLEDPCLSFQGMAMKEEEEEEGEVCRRRVALAALQFVANLTAGNAYTAERVYGDCCPEVFLRWFECFSSSSRDRKLCMTICVIVHNGLACSEDRAGAVATLLGAAVEEEEEEVRKRSSSRALLCKLLRVVMPPFTTNKEEEEEDPVFEWVYMIVVKIVEAKRGKDAFLFSGCTAMEPAADLTQLPIVFTAEQLVLLNLFEHMLGDSHVNGTKNDEANNILLCDDGALLSELVDRVRLYVEVEGLTDDNNMPMRPEAMMVEEAVATVLRILAEVLVLEEEEEKKRKGQGNINGLDNPTAAVRDTLVAQDLVRVVLKLLQKEGGQADGQIPAMNAAAAAATRTAREGRKAQLIRVLGNLCHGCHAAQEQVRIQGGLPLVLNHCNVDSANPLLREWALFLVRNLCEGNEENQKAIAALQPQGTVQSPALQEMGMEPRLVAGQDGKIRVTVAKQQQQQQD